MDVKRTELIDVWARTSAVEFAAMADEWEPAAKALGMKAAAFKSAVTKLRKEQREAVVIANTELAPAISEMNAV